MKQLGTVLTILIVAFWITMNTLLVWRDVEFRRQGAFKRGVDSYLGDLSLRESWLSIYQDNRKVGYSGYTIEKIYAEEGIEYQVAIETLYRGKWPLPNFLSQLLQDSNQIRIQGRLFLDEELLPTKLRLDIVLTFLRGTSVEQSRSVFLVGERTEDRFLVGIHLGDEIGAKPDFQVALPIETIMLSNGLSPTLPIADYEPGKRYQISVFDPLSSLGFDAETATVEVIGKEEKEIDRIRVDVFEVETRFRGQTSRAWVTASGETLRQEIGKPFDLLLRKEKGRLQALKGFEPFDPGANDASDPKEDGEKAKKEPAK